MRSILPIFLSLICAVTMHVSVGKQHDMEQKPVTFSLPQHLQKGSNSKSGSSVHKTEGEPCHNSNECAAGLCCLRKSNQRTCQKNAPTGRPCSDGQLKGNVYIDHCPCQSSEDVCQGGVCVSSEHGNARRRRHASRRNQRRQ
uniref:Prokineticin domain-containing protein n=1 Tax=Amblyomma maculatum TaxID=34609 RepID=G3MTP7_AMBMU